MNVTTSNKRLLALDVMRGITIAYDLSKYARFLATCVCSPQTCRVDWINSYRSGIPILYVHYGNLHVHLFEKVQFHLQCSRMQAGLKNSQTDRDHFPDWNWHQPGFPFSASSTIPSLSTRFAFSESCNGLLWDMELLP